MMRLGPQVVNTAKVFLDAMTACGLTGTLLENHTQV